MACVRRSVHTTKTGLSVRNCDMARAKAAAARSRGLALAALFLGALLAVAQGAAVRTLTDGAPVVALALRRRDAVLTHTVRPLAQTPSSTRRRRPRARRQASGSSDSLRRGAATASSSSQPGVRRTCCTASRRAQVHACVSDAHSQEAEAQGLAHSANSSLGAQRSLLPSWRARWR